ncbi:unnamed protein product [Trifolium pratense]|uniref:Uncharacterized protein n=1 Tax=Trifolium pratense TaxID=57577 RepID=A0ACB0I8Q8_TRIPR|nr:unnamed protein product [Trifolium pratense]
MTLNFEETKSQRRFNYIKSQRRIEEERGHTICIDCAPSAVEAASMICAYLLLAGIDHMAASPLDWKHIQTLIFIAFRFSTKVFILIL